ncbi:MAG: AsmA family protein, partial [Balneolaceae bacterium]
MKLFLKILAGFLVFFIILIIGLNIYFTDNRLKNMILPQVNETLGREVQVEKMSLTFFRTFPQLGVSIEKFLLPGDDGIPVASLDELVIAVKLFPLLRGNVAISELRLIRPEVNYIIYEDETTNIDFLLALADEKDEEVADDKPMAITIPEFTLRNAFFVYDDRAGNTKIDLRELNADISLAFAELIESTIDAELGGLSYSSEGSDIINNLALSLKQTSFIDLERENVTISQGTLSIRGLALNLTGELNNWSAEEPEVDLQFTSSSENFGEFLRLAPPGYEEYLAGLETRGSLILDGSIAGKIEEGILPRFDIILEVNDGYLKNPDLPEAIREITLKATASNDIVQIEQFQATAGNNSLRGSGKMERPFDDDAPFSFEANGDMDLSTVSSFYPIGDFGIEQLSGLLALQANANGRIDQPENAFFTGHFELTNGLLKYEDVPRSIENINAVVRGSH